LNISNRTWLKWVSNNQGRLLPSERFICLFYVDNTLFFTPNVSDIDMILEKLKELKMELNVQDDFFGVIIKKLDEGTIELTQSGLIKRILEAMWIEGANPKSTSAEMEALPADKTEIWLNHLSIMQV